MLTISPDPAMLETKCRSGAPESHTWWYRRAECASEPSWAAAHRAVSQRAFLHIELDGMWGVVAKSLD